MAVLECFDAVWVPLKGATAFVFAKWDNISEKLDHLRHVRHMIQEVIGLRPMIVKVSTGGENSRPLGAFQG